MVINTNINKLIKKPKNEIPTLGVDEEKSSFLKRTNKGKRKKKMIEEWVIIYNR